jgi:RNA polymerase sigma-70 factor (ECF subfamily)
MIGVLTRSEEAEDAASLQRLAQRVADGDSTAFEALFRRLSKRVFRYVRGMIGDASPAHDVTQDTFMRLWSSRERLADVDEVEAYVFQTARRLVYNRTRDERVRRENEALVEVGDLATCPLGPDDDVDADLLRELLERWIAALPDRQREALTLRRMKGMSRDTIAEVMGISPNTVNTHLMRAMDTLRDRLREHRPDLMHE